MGPNDARTDDEPRKNFWDNVDKNGPIPLSRPDLGPCWLWKKSKNKRGYGKASKKGGGWMLAHRAAYQLLIGPLAKGEVPDHLCRVNDCVNPYHLDIVTNVENILRGFSQNAINAKKTQCIRGHLLEGDNVYRYIRKGRPHRACNACRKVRAKINKEKRLTELRELVMTYR